MKKLAEKIQTLSLAKRQSIHYALLAVGAFLLILGHYSYEILLVLGVLTLFLMLFYSFVAFRCPECGAFLGERMIRYSHCPKCGKPLDE